MECSITNCDGNAKARGWCNRHWLRWRRHGDPLAGGANRQRREGTCVMPDCNRPKYTEHCNMHYQRLLKTGSLELVYIGKGGLKNTSPCNAEGCNEPHFSNGWCRLHNARMYLRGSLNPTDLRRAKGSCSLSNCNKPHAAKSYCSMHYARFLRWGDARPDLGNQKQPSTPERVRAQKRAGETKRRATKNQAATIPFTTEQLEQRLSMSPICYLCGNAPGVTVDHVKPLSKGGLHVLSNLRGACLSCNSAKGADW